jgi:hypothetical protein
MGKAKSKTSKLSKIATVARVAGAGLKLAARANPVGAALTAVGVVGGAIGVGKAIYNKAKGKKGANGKPKKSVRQSLKKAYEKRAKFKLRMGNLGGAKKDLNAMRRVV